ncbi:Uncharacterized protein T310_2992 [Rasamsonia emersonii CBS 393.64]|uniref:FAD-binding domain-containing protein n=1 Tax=Rasamsonia emersonii (strain ATCC 16479 / CBS 393.64 / IMI 116815) TaxID=1408163 RepID=A0A0F4YZB5_RASE3|nr:Uncharacterized protein T310_2992 [Rasamsonia emersonii CBS 393.64]KKA22978.1 Uncharacterized protein T310_2992 [Rasamsonia emersonii CBS 393.64]
MAAKHNGLANGSQTPLKASIFQSRTNRAAAPANDALRLKIIVVGAGLGGLATAIALAQHGHSVTVYEQTPQLGEVGAGIQIPSNSTRLLVDLGLEPYLQDYVTEPRGIFFRRWENGQVIGHTRLIPDFRQTYHAAYYVIHRADFHTALYRRAIDLGVTVRLDSRVVDYDANRPSVTFQDGTSVSADLIVAADGVKSIARRIVLEGNDQPPRRTGFAAYRSTVEVDRLKRDPEIRSLLQEPALNIWIGDQRHVMTYTIGAGKTFNLVLSHPDDTDPSGWDQSRALEDMKAEFRGWDPTLTKIIAMVDKTLKWPLLSGTPLDRWVSGKLVILGDAAHAMVPYMSQGAAMAVEDGVALAHSLSKVRVREHIPTALSIFERVRQKRTTQMQEASLLNGQLWHFADGPLQQVRDRAMMPEVEGRLFSHSPNQWSDPTTQVWCYGYDARGEFDRAWMGQKRKSSL